MKSNIKFCCGQPVHPNGWSSWSSSLQCWRKTFRTFACMPLSVLNVEILDLDVHGTLTLTLALIGHGPLALIGLEEFFNHSLSWWLTESHALAGIVVGKRPHWEVLTCQVPEGRKCRLRQEEGPVCVVHPVEGVHVHEIGLHVGVTECVSQATDVAHPVFGLGWVGRGQVVELLL